MAKIHLAANKGNDGAELYALCASKSLGNGTCVKNSRKTYVEMRSVILSAAEYKKTPSSDRCSHCEQMGLTKRNKQRAAKGLPPVNSFDEQG